MLVADRVLLSFVPDTSLSFPNYENFVRTADPKRPWLIVIGSSRGRDGVDEALLNQNLRDAGLPHQGFNLSLGGGGTPSLIYAAMKNASPVFEQFPPGSKIVYVFSNFEMNFVRIEALEQFPVGAELIRQNGYEPPQSWISRFAHVSGFAAFAQARGWKDFPQPMTKVLQQSSERLLIGRRLASCNDAGQYDYRILPINAQAMDALAARFGKDLLVVKAPVGDIQQQDDQRNGVEEIGNAYLRKWGQENAIEVMLDFPERLALSPLSFATNCDHIRREEDKVVLAKAIVGLLK